MDIHILVVMYIYIPNLVYNSLDVRYTVFFYNYKFRERDDCGIVVCRPTIRIPGSNSAPSVGFWRNRVNEWSSGLMLSVVLTRKVETCVPSSSKTTDH